MDTNTRRTINQIQEEQDSIREEMNAIKGKLDQIMETILALAIREEELRNDVATRNQLPIQGSTSRPAVPNSVIYGLPAGYTPPFEGVSTQPGHTYMITDGATTQGPSTANQIPLPRIDEELQDEYEMKNYHGVVPVVDIVIARDSESI